MDILRSERGDRPLHALAPDAPSALWVRALPKQKCSVSLWRILLSLIKVRINKVRIEDAWLRQHFVWRIWVGLVVLQKRCGCNIQPWYRVTIWENMIYSGPLFYTILYRMNSYYLQARLALISQNHWFILVFRARLRGDYASPSVP